MFAKKYLYLLLILKLCALVQLEIITKSKIACEWDELNLECKSGDLLKIVSSNYGRFSTAVCSYEKNTNCYSSDSINIVKLKCEGLPSCKVWAKNDVFGDPCPYTIKYLEVQYKCVPAPRPSVN